MDAFLILPVESFTMDYYTDAYLLAEGASELETYSDEYEELVDQLAQQLEPLSKERSALRYDEPARPSQTQRMNWPRPRRRPTNS